MSGGGGSSTQTIQKSDPWPGQQPFLSDVFGTAQDIFRNNPQGYYPGQTYLPFNPIQQSAIDEQLGNVTDLQNISGSAQGGLGTLLGAADLQNNPYAQQYGDALSQNLFGNVGTTIDQLGRGFNTQLENLGFGQRGQIGELGRAFEDQSSALGLGLGSQIGQQQRAYDVSSSRALDDILNLGERQSRDFGAFRTQLEDDLTSRLLPSISADAVGAGQAGSSRQGVAEGIALKNAQDRLAELGRTQQETLGSQFRASGLGLGDLARSQSENLGLSTFGAGQELGQLGRTQAEGLRRGAEGSILGAGQLAREQAGQLGGVATNLGNQANQSLAQFFSNQYGQGLDATKAGLLASPAIAGLTQAPYQSLAQAGQTIQGQAQLPLQESINRYNANQQAPWDALNQYASIIQGLPAGLGTQTTSGPEGSQFGSVLGGGLAGAGLANSLGLLGGAAGFTNPFGLGLAGLGALGGFF